MEPSPDDWFTRHSPARTAHRTVALVNVLTPAGPRPDAVAAVLREYGEEDPLDLSVTDVARMRDAALRLREVFAAATADEAAGRLNHLLAGNCGPVRLTSHGGHTPWHLHLDRHDEAPWAEWFLSSSCLTLAVLLWDRQLPPGGVCASSACANVFVTSTSGTPRRYCSARCATRERVAAHRRAARNPDAGPPGAS